MPATLREFLSDRLLHSAVERAMERQEIERAIARESPSKPGYQSALSALRSAKRRESALLWLGWRLHPRTLISR